MSLPCISKDAKMIVIEAPAAAGQTSLTSDVIDTQGFESVTICYWMGSITTNGVQSVACYSNTTNSASGGTAITGASKTIADDGDNTIYQIHIAKPTARYIYATLSRATQDSVLNGAFAILEGASVKPVTQGSGVATPVVVTA